MTRNSLLQPVLVEQEQALSVYLNAMLNDVEDYALEFEPQFKNHFEGIEYEVLLAKSAGLTFGLQWSAITGIVTLADNLESLPCNGPKWLLGMLRHESQEVMVIDVATLMRPTVEGALSRSNSIVIIGEGRWGIACEIIDRLSLFPEDISWRAERKACAFLLGMARKPPCALIDVEKMIEDAKLELNDWLN